MNEPTAEEVAEAVSLKALQAAVASCDVMLTCLGPHLPKIHMNGNVSRVEVMVNAAATAKAYLKAALVEAGYVKRPEGRK